MSVQTHTFKVAEGCEIKADVWGAEPGASRPLLMWIHGGGLIFGSRRNPRPGLLAALREAGLVVVSIDHRLAPQTKLPDIVADVQDAWRWLQQSGAALLGVDPTRAAVAGSSAGGYLSLMCGFKVQPRPRALVSLFGFGDITTPWETQRSEHYRQYPLVTEQAAWLAVGNTPVAEAPAEPDRSDFYLYCRQQGLWPQHVAGHDPARVPRWFDAWCPARQVTADYPPTLLVHGTADTDVPFEESQGMAAALAAAGVQHELLALPGVGHGFSGAVPADVAATERSVAAFLARQLA